MNIDLLSSHESVVIDVGGTHIDVHLVRPNSDSFSETIISLPTPPTSKGVIETIGRIIHNSLPKTSVLIGLPGPVRSSSNSVFCPPLGFALNKADFTDFASTGRRISIVNDLACLASMLLIKRLAITHKNSLLVTIGTSMGLAKITQSGTYSVVDTYESAHSLLSHTASINIAPFEAKQPPIYVRDLVNANYLISMHELYRQTDRESEYWNCLLPCIYEELLNVIAPFQPIDNLLIYGGFVEWLHSEDIVNIASAIIRQLLALRSTATQFSFISKQDCLAAKIVAPSNTLVLDKWSI